VGAPAGLPTASAILDAMPTTAQPLLSWPRDRRAPRDHRRVLRPSPTRALQPRLQDRATRSSARLAYFRSTRHLRSGSTSLNLEAEGADRAICRCRQPPRGDRQFYAGDIRPGRPQETYTANPGRPRSPVISRSMTFPEPVIEVKIEPNERDQDKMGIPSAPARRTRPSGSRRIRETGDAHAGSVSSTSTCWSTA